MVEADVMVSKASVERATFASSRDRSRDTSRDLSRDFDEPAMNPADAELLLAELAAVFLSNAGRNFEPDEPDPSEDDSQLADPQSIYRNLVEQIPAVIFRARLDRGVGEAYVSPQIEASLGFSQEQWLEDPIRWYQQIHPEDKQRWSTEAAEMFLSGRELRSAYRVIARDGRVVWFHCHAKMIRRKDGRPLFIHGIAFDITELKRTEEALQEERNVVSAILNTVGALVVVLDPQGRIVRFNRASEQVSGYSSAETVGKYFWDICLLPEDAERFKIVIERLLMGKLAAQDHETAWHTRKGTRRLIVWSSTVLHSENGEVAFIIASGIDITERKRLEKALLEISASEQRRIGQDLHDGLGQHLTGIAFMSKVQEQRLAAQGIAEATEATSIVRLVNEAIHKTRELAHGLLPVAAEPRGLMSALARWAAETEETFHISCHFSANRPVLIHDSNISTHLYRIAQEAVNNGIKHGQAKSLLITLSAGKEFGRLTVENDGQNMPESTTGAGMGLQIMNYRASMIGGTLKVVARKPSGVVVSCTFPLPAQIENLEGLNDHKTA